MTTRRDCLALMAAMAAPMASWSASAATARSPLRLAAAWDAAAEHRVGVLRPVDGALRVDASLRVPTRAHGLLEESDGRLLAVARRPGDWLLRWQRDGRVADEHWMEPDRALNGHVVASADGRTLYTTETDLDSGAGLVGVRDARTLERLREWPTAGLDPHELAWDADGSLLVANGGIPTQPETGRAKVGLERMDPSLVRLDPASGRVLGQWRLDDPRLSVRHLARLGDRVAVALQAEHDEDEQRLAAPVLALFDGRSLRVAQEPPRPLAGYGGSVAAAAGRFYVGCPRANGLACWRSDGEWLGFVPLAEACAVAASEGRAWVGGRDAGLFQPVADGSSASDVPATWSVAGLRLDNHWIGLTPLPA